MTAIISNPPYNLKIEAGEHEWNVDKELLSTNANYGFIRVGFDLSDGLACYLLPLGVLSTKNKLEMVAKQELVDGGYIRAIATLPDKMFEATQIPVCLMVLQKTPTDAILMLDLKKEGEPVVREQRGQYGGNSHTGRVYKKTINVLPDEVIRGVAEAILEQKEYKNLSRLVPIDDIKQEDYLLTPANYMELMDDLPEKRSFEAIVHDLNIFRRHKNKLKLVINQKLARELGLDLSLYLLEDGKKRPTPMENNIKKITGLDIIKNDFIQITKNKNQFDFKNNDPELFSEILETVYKMWIAQIKFLNNMENMYIAELRDALLPKLMSGEIDLEGIEVEGDD